MKRTATSESNNKNRAASLGLPALMVLGGAIIGCNSPSGPPPPTSPQFYETQVRPILRSNCYRCHSGFNHKGDLQLDTREHILHGGKNGAVIVPGHPEESLLVKLVRHEGPAQHPMPMPPKGKLSDGDIATITEWIQAGAIMPEATER